MTAIRNNMAESPSFWKKNAQSLPGSIKPVYGAQHPPRHGSPHGTPKQTVFRSKDSFEAFKAKTNDAWDDADDEIVEMSNIRMSLKDVRSTALQVIKNHSHQQQQQQEQDLDSTEALSRIRCDSVSDGDVGDAKERSSVAVAKSNGSNYSNGTNPVKDRLLLTSMNCSSSAPNTPSHLLGHRLNGPGLGVRLESRWISSKSSPYGQLPTPDRESVKLEKFKLMLRGPSVNFDELKKLSWSGIPMKYRATTWKLLSGYLPLIFERHEPMLERKRQEYHNFVDQYYSTRLEDIHQDTYRQIHIDIPRMSPLIPLFQQELVQEIFERILYIWAIRHPASGYVQGINDLVTPIFVIFLTEYMNPDVDDLENYKVSQISEINLEKLEADTFWCFSKLLDGIQDNYTFAQPGIQRRVNSLKELISRIDNGLHQHLEQQHVEYLQFSFRWMNNLLMREMPLHCVIRLWDTYLSESDGFASFHLYVCAAMLTKFSEELQRESDFQGLMLLLQNLPTHDWTNEDIGLLLADAYRLKFMFADAPKHLHDAMK